MALITGQQVADFLHIAYDDGDDSLAQAVTLACAVVVGITGQNIAADTYTHLLPVAADGRVTLPQRPVTDIDTVTVDGAAVTEGDSGWTWDGISSAIRLHVTPQSRNAYVATVTYDAGYATVPDDIQAVALSIAARLYSGGTAAVASETIDDYSVTYTTEAADGVTGLESRILRRYRNRLGSLAVTS